MRFDTCLQFILDREGFYSDDPVDRGGATKWGVTQRTYDSYRKKHSLDARPVLQMDDAEMRALYREAYWTPMRCDDMGEPLDLVLFDSAIQHGTYGATKLLQQALQIPADGILGPVTLRHARNCLSDAVIHERREYYAKIIRNDPTQQRFEKGWNNRLNSLEKAL